MNLSDKQAEFLMDCIRECFVELQNLSTQMIKLFTELQRMRYPRPPNEKLPKLTENTEEE